MSEVLKEKRTYEVVQDSVERSGCEMQEVRGRPEEAAFFASKPELYPCKYGRSFRSAL